MNGIPTALPLRIGCAFVNLYAGFYLVTDPARYHKFVPNWLNAISESVASVDTYLRIQGVGEILIAMTLLCWFMPKWAVRLAASTLALEMTLILLFIGVDSVTFRNVGLLGAALALVIESYQEREAPQAARATNATPHSARLSVSRG